jgi:hypothetical protein
MLLKLRNTDGLNFEAMEEWLKAPAAMLRKRWLQLMNDRLRDQPNREWTKEEEAMLIKLYQSGMTDKDELAAELGRTKKAVDARIHRLREHLPNRKKRTPQPSSITVDDDDDAATTEDEDDQPTVAKRQQPTTVDDDDDKSDDDDDGVGDLWSTMALYDRTVGQPYKERRKTIARYRGWLLEGITNQFLPKTEQVEREVTKCDDLIRLLQE